MNTVGSVVLVATVTLATVVGLVLQARSGRIRAGGTASGGWVLAARPPRGPERVLLLQLSAPGCAPCRQAARLLQGLAARTPELLHLEVDLAERPELAGALGVMRTPTLVAFGHGGEELLRVSGVPRLGDLEAALAPALGRV